MARALLIALAAMVCFLGGCRACGPAAAVVAQLAEREGGATRELGAKPGAWDDAQKGTTFVMGDAVRTDAASRAKVTLTSGGALQLHENTTIRFLAQGASVRRVAVETGEAEVDLGDIGLSIQTSLGIAQIEPGSRVHVVSSPKGLKFEVLVGRAQFDAEAEGGAGRTIVAGQRFLVSMGVAKLESMEPAPVDAGKPRVDAGVVVDAAPAAAVTDASDAAALDGVLVEVHGDGVRSGPAGKGPLTALAAGSSRLADGSRLSLPVGASVEVTRGTEHASMVGRSEIDIGKAGEALVRVRSGRLLLRTKTVGKRVDVPGGSIVLAAAGPGDVQAEIEVDYQGTRVVSNQSQLELRGTGGTATVGPGQTGKLDSHGKPTTDEATSSAADVTIDVGESSIIHSPRGVANVRVRVPACTGEAIVQYTNGGAVRRMFARGEGTSTAVLPLSGGSHRYTVHCVGSADAHGDQSGNISVLRDSGAAHVVRTAPVNVVDADGRRYSILYQNILPQMTFRWSHAPADGTVSLHLERAGAPMQKFPASAGAVSLPSGTVREGSYSAWFEADGRPQVRSPETTVRIAFDNAAPAAEIQQPVDGQPGTPTVHVAGVASEGSAVTVAGTSVPMDPQSRFDGDVPGPPSGDRGIAVRISHPAHGIHYYLRMFAAQTESPGATVTPP